MNWQYIGGAADTAEIVAAGHQLFKLHETGRVFEWGLTSTDWRELCADERTAQIAWDGQTLYQRHKSGMILEYVGPPFTGWRVLDDVRATVDIIAEGGSVFQRHDTGKVWEYLPSARPPYWTDLGGKRDASEFAVASNQGFGPPGPASPKHLLYERLVSGQIFKYAGASQGWTEISNDPHTAEIAVKGRSLYRRDRGGQISEFTGTPGRWSEIGNNPESAQLVAGGASLYLRLETGRVFRYTGTPYEWDPLADDSPTASITAARGSGTLYKRHHDGSVWVFRDDPSVEPR